MILYIKAVTSDYSDNFKEQEAELLKIVKTMSTCKDGDQAKKSTVFKKHTETIKSRMEKCVAKLEEEQKGVCELKATNFKATYWNIKIHVDEYFELWKLTNMIVKQLGVAGDDNDDSEEEDEDMAMDDKEDKKDDDDKDSKDDKKSRKLRKAKAERR